MNQTKKKKGANLPLYPGLSRELRPIEQVYRQYFHQYPERRLDELHTLPEVLDLLVDMHEAYPEAVPFVPDEALKDDVFSLGDTGLAIIQHQRYMPCYWHTHSFYEMLYCVKGGATNYLGGEVRQMRAGDICLMSPGTTHAVSVFDEDTIACNVLFSEDVFISVFYSLFEGEDILKDFLDYSLHGGGKVPYLFIPTGQDEKLAQIFGELLGEFFSARNRYRADCLQSLAKLFFVRLFRAHISEAQTASLNSPGQEGNRNTLLILQYMQSHYRTVNMKELSAFFHYSPRQLERLIKAATGRTFLANIRMQKIQAAQGLLTETDLPIEEVGLEAGFSTPSNFRNLFLKETGLLPSEFRKQARR